MPVDPDLANLPILASALDLERWFEQCGVDEREHWIRIVKKGRPGHSVDLPELIESCLAFGWVDVKTKRVDDDTYAIRLTPRRSRSNWTDRNRQIARELIVAGRMRPEGFDKLPADLEDRATESTNLTTAAIESRR